MIYICFGVTKSASTFLYQLTEEVFRVAHRKPVRLGPPFRPRTSLDNYVDVIDPALLRAVAVQIGTRDVVLKTHGPLHPDVATLIEAGEILASASIRDPREIALSMLDHGRRSRRWGYVEFSEYHDLRDTLASLDDQIERFRAWAALSCVSVFTYNEICFGTASVVAALAARIGVAAPAADVLRPFRDNRGIGQFSKGAALRYREMPPAEQPVFLDRYAWLYDRYTFDTPAAVIAADRQRERPVKARGQLAQYGVQLRRHLRFRA